MIHRSLHLCESKSCLGLVQTSRTLVGSRYHVLCIIALTTMKHHNRPQRRFCYSPHFTDEETEAQGVEVICPRSRSTEEDPRAVSFNPVPPAAPSLAHSQPCPFYSAARGPHMRMCAQVPIKATECLQILSLGLLF